MLKPSTSACVTIFLTAIFVVGVAATTYHYYGIPHPTNLRILYTHSEEMVDEIVRDFERWYQQNYGQPIQVMATLTDPETAFKKTMTKHRKTDAEIWWGGPLSLFEKAHAKLLPYNSTHKNDINLTCHSCPLMDLSDKTTHWYAASLYGLGVMYNEHRLDQLGLDKPRTWADLNSGKYEGNITMVDPIESEFVSPVIMLMLESRNWTSGWEYLVTLSALIEQYDTGERDSALKVSSDYLPLAVVPDFYAYERMAMCIPQINFTYLDATILQPDPIAIIKRGVYLDEAKAFVDYVLTKETQSKIGEYCLPLRQDVTPSPPRINPFAPEFPQIYRYNESLQEIIGDYYKTWITRRHDNIKIAYREIREANKTKDVNSNATYYFNLAWGNFTYAKRYTNRTEIENIYNKTNCWTENVTFYTGGWMEDKWVDGKWGNASREAYNRALKHAKMSKQAAGVSNSGQTQMTPSYSQNELPLL